MEIISRKKGGWESILHSSRVDPESVRKYLQYIGLLFSSFLLVTFFLIDIKFVLISLSVLILFGVAFLKIEFALFILLLSFSYAYPIIITPYGPSTYIRLDDLIFTLILTIWLLKMLGSGKISINITPLGRSILMFLSFILISFHRILFTSNVHHFMYASFHFIKLLQYFLVYILVSNCKLDEREKKYLFYSIWIAGLIVGIIGVLQITGVADIRYYGYEEMVRGKGGIVSTLSYNYAHLGMYMLIVISITLSLLLSSKSLIWRISLLISMHFFLFVLFCTTSRASYLGLIGSGVIYLILKRREGWGILGLYLFLITLSVYLIEVFELNELISLLILKTLQFDQEGFYIFTDYSRIIIWKNLIEYLINNLDILLFGVGFMGYGYYLAEPTSGYAGHNNFLHVLAETGIFGLVSFIIFLSTACRCVLKTIKESKTPFLKEVRIGFFCAFVGLLLTSFTQETFSVQPAMTNFLGYFLFLLAVIISKDQ